MMTVVMAVMVLLLFMMPLKFMDNDIRSHGADGAPKQGSHRPLAELVSDIASSTSAD